MTYITPNAHNRTEWSRMAQAAYAANLNLIGARYSAAASVAISWAMPVPTFDRLQAGYRAWLVSGEWPS